MLFQIPDCANISVVKRFMRGVFQLRPSLPRYQSVCNVHSVFNFVRNQLRVEDLPLKALTMRLTFCYAFYAANGVKLSEFYDRIKCYIERIYVQHG